MALRSNLFDVDIAALERLLADANERLVARRDELVAAMDRVPPSFESHDDIERARIFATRLGKLLTECDRQRKADKASFVKAGKSVDRFFAAISTPADDALKDLEQRMERTAHPDQPPAPNAAATRIVSSADLAVILSASPPAAASQIPDEVLVWEVKAVNRAALDLETLRDLFTDRELDTVIQRHLRKAGPNALRGVTYRKAVRLH